MITKPLLSPARRSLCDTCDRPARACICRWARPVASKVEIVILQHPLEVTHPKGSARLLHLSLPRSRLAIGEEFGEAALHDLLYQPWHMPPAPAAPLRQPVLLYPDTEDLPAPSMQKPDTLDASNLRLIVLDGTWRKSRRMLHAHPLLHRLPRLTLEALPPSRYRIRHAYRSSQLSTLEAVCHALAQLDNDEEKYRPLLEAFDGFIETQRAWFSGEKA